VYENKQKDDNFTEEKSDISTQRNDILCKRTRILLKASAFLSVLLALGGGKRAVGRWLVTTSACNHPRRSCAAPPESGGEPGARLDRRLHPRKIPVYATMYMKTRGLRQKSRIPAGMHRAEFRLLIASRRDEAQKKGGIKK
jgi:hypothetical protein